jgi:hypothetical protein
MRNYNIAAFRGCGEVLANLLAVVMALRGKCHVAELSGFLSAL